MFFFNIASCSTVFEPMFPLLHPNDRLDKEKIPSTGLLVGVAVKLVNVSFDKTGSSFCFPVQKSTSSPNDRLIEGCARYLKILCF